MAERPCMKLVNPSGAGPIIRVDTGAGAGASRDLILAAKDGTEVFSVDVNGLPDPGGGQAKREVVVNYGDVVADSDTIKHLLWKAKKAVTLTNIYLWVDTATADGSTNRQTITVKRSSDDATVVAFQTAAENPGLAQATVTTMGELSNTSIAADEYLYVEFTKASSGLALSGLTFQIEHTLAA
jgi:hypothetical protein